MSEVVKLIVEAYVNLQNRLRDRTFYDLTMARGEGTAMLAQVRHSIEGRSTSNSSAYLDRAATSPKRFTYLAGVILAIKPSSGLNVCLAKSV